MFLINCFNDLYRFFFFFFYFGKFHIRTNNEKNLVFFFFLCRGWSSNGIKWIVCVIKYDVNTPESQKKKNASNARHCRFVGTRHYNACDRIFICTAVFLHNILFGYYSIVGILSARQHIEIIIVIGLFCILYIFFPHLDWCVLAHFNCFVHNILSARRTHNQSFELFPHRLTHDKFFSTIVSTPKLTFSSLAWAPHFFFGWFTFIFD